MLLTVVQTLLFNFLDGKNFPVSKQTKQKNHNQNSKSEEQEESETFVILPVYFNSLQRFLIRYHATLHHRSILIYVCGFYSAWRETHKHHAG